MDRDISTNVILVLVVLTLLVSALGTWIVADKLDVGKPETRSVNNQGGNVGLTIDEEPPKEADSAGNVGFTKIN